MAAPLSKQLEIDFYREVPNRNLKALAVRSDGRILGGPTLRELPGSIPADLLWTIAPTTDQRAWLIGTGPEGKVFRVETNVRTDYKVSVAVDLEATHVAALLPLDQDSFLAGTSPQGSVTLVRKGQIVAALELPVDSIFDFIRQPGEAKAVLIATGNPGRIYRLDLAAFEAAGVAKGKVTALADLAQHGVQPFGEVRDRNVRRLLALSDGRVMAGSAPKGNVYAFSPSGGAPLLLMENKEAEVTDLLLDSTGGFYAAITLSGTLVESRVNRPAPPVPAAAAGATPAPTPEADPADVTRNERFPGRGQLVYFPPGGLPETVMSRSNTAFYRLAWHDDTNVKWILISGGEQGELLAYAPGERRSLNLGATGSAQVNAILPSQAGVHGLFHLLRNNPTGLSQLNFYDGGERSLETRKIDLGVAAEIGQLHFTQAGSHPSAKVRVALRTSFGSDELEGWSGWVDLQPTDGAWFAPGLVGRYVRLRMTIESPVQHTPVIDKATLHFLPQNRRPQLSDFRIFPPHLGLVPAAEAAATPPNSTLGQLLAPAGRDGKDDSGTTKRRASFLNSLVVPQPGAQFVYWTLTDADDDNLAATFSLRPEQAPEWIDLAIDTTDSYVQFDITHLPEGRYFSRLVVSEQAPRPADQRLRYTFETDSLTIDRTAPEIVRVSAEKTDAVWRVLVEGKDTLSQLAGAEVILNNGTRTTLEHPVDGILDGRQETFIAEFPEAKAAGATSAEILLYDQSGNSSSRRVPLQP